MKQTHTVLPTDGDGTDGSYYSSEEIMARIREAISQRKAESGLSMTEFDALATGSAADPSMDDLRRDLKRLSEALHYSSIEMMLSDARPSPITGLVQRARGALHEVILFYVNRLAAQQATVNRLNLRTLGTALALLESQEARIRVLENKVGGDT